MKKRRISLIIVMIMVLSLIGFVVACDNKTDPTGTTAPPVSYTHLDVYKRQDNWNVNCPTFAAVQRSRSRRKVPTDSISVQRIWKIF